MKRMRVIMLVFASTLLAAASAFAQVLGGVQPTWTRLSPGVFEGRLPDGQLVYRYKGTEGLDALVASREIELQTVVGPAQKEHEAAVAKLRAMRDRASTTAALSPRNATTACTYTYELNAGIANLPGGIYQPWGTASYDKRTGVGCAARVSVYLEGHGSTVTYDLPDYSELQGIHISLKLENGYVQGDPLWARATSCFWTLDGSDSECYEASTHLP